MSHTPNSSRRVQCLLCPTTITLNNFSTHLKNKHPERVGEPRKGLYGELDTERIHRPPARVTPKPVVVEAPAPQLPPLGAEDIVTTVVEQLAEPSGMIPVTHLAAILTWHEATAAFLRSVSR